MQPDKENHLWIFSCRGKLLLWSDLLDFELASFWPLVGSLGYYVQLFQSCPLVTWTKDVACTGGRCAGWDIIHRGQSLEATKALKIKVTAFVILFNRWWFCKTFQSLRIQADSLTRPVTMTLTNSLMAFKKVAFNSIRYLDNDLVITIY